MAMGLIILLLKIYMAFVIVVMCVYMLRHYRLTLNRFLKSQRFYYHDIYDSELPSLSVLVPMHNEEKVAASILERLVNCEYEQEKGGLPSEKPDGYEIIPIDDHSSDKTREIISEFAERYDCIKPLFRENGKRGKQNALNDAIDKAKGEVILVFDADYLPPKGLLKDLTICFKDPEVGSVMGRVIPVNLDKLLTRMLELERTGGYQVDQQARHNLRFVPQYGGTVGGFRRDVLRFMGGFDENILTEDTELTFKLLERGWKIVYANRTECYEEAPEDWDTRGRQIKRWANGHTTVMIRYVALLLKSRYLSLGEKVDGFMLLGIYLIPSILFLGMLDAIALFFLGEMNLIASAFIFLFVAAYNSYGNFAPFYQVAIASLIDGGTYRIRLVPFLVFSYFFNLWYIAIGNLLAFLTIFKIIGRRGPTWEKTTRFREESAKQSGV